MLDILKKSIKVRISLKGIAHSVIDDVLEPALKKVVADSSNKLDDVVMASMYDKLEEELKKAIDSKLDDIVLKVPEKIRDFIEIN